MGNFHDQRDTLLKFIEKGQPSQNGYVERFNRTYREEVLDNFTFNFLKQVRVITHSWMWICQL
ncbi:MAG: transposase [Bacteroidia bacterium]|nr:transposase [Bacteroidia bacterium]